MKILELRFQNLNSLYGEWRIDFTAAPYESDGIFAITGPTGSGKSTIMDAICLALYGETPRLGRITASENGIMSRKTGECYAEVVFASQTGRFRCRWSQHRARNKPAGKLGQAEHEISDAVTGLFLESKLTETRRAIEERTGMDFDRFTRSILLAQGGFSAFLAAKPDERAPVLEQLTGTEIYSDLSMRAFERYKAEASALEVLQAEVGGIQVLSPEQVETLQADLTRLAAEEKAGSERALWLRSAIQWLEGLANLRTEIAGLEAEAVAQATDTAAFQPDRERLERARKAAELEGSHAALAALRTQQKADQEALPGLETSKAAAETEWAAQKTAHGESEAAVKRARDAAAQAAPLLVRVRALDLKVEAQAKSVVGLNEALTRARSEARKNRELLEAATKDVVTFADALAELDAFLKVHAVDEALAGRFESIEERLGSLKSDAKSLADKRGEWENARGRLATCEAEEARLKSVLEGLAAKHKAQAATVEAKMAELAAHLDGRLLRELRADHEALLRELALVKKIESLEKERMSLQEGKPCPLCGATEHPFAAGNHPEADDVETRIEGSRERIRRAEELEAEIKALEGSAKQAEDEARKADDARKQAAFDRTVAGTDSDRLAREIEGLETQAESRRTAARALLQPFGVEALDLASVDALLANLKTRAEQWTKHADLRAKEATRLQELEGKVARSTAVQETLDAPLEKQAAEAAAAEQVEKDLRAERAEAFGTKSPDVEEKALAKGVVDAETAEVATRAKLNKVESEIGALSARISALQENLAKRGPELAETEREFLARAAAAGFTDEPAFLAASLPTEARSTLEQQARELDERGSGIKSRRADREARLAAEEARAITTVDADVLRAESLACEAALKGIAQEMGGIRQKLVENERAGTRVREKMARIETAKLEVKRWAALRDLIGSADGKKYRNFAQGITFEMMVRHANRQLRKLTDRYLLVCSDDQPLELEVIDDYQAGERRSTKNLSGGESFLVSLALALGLSKMASRKVRVDSLFLDEGFGTLDEEALESALETLAGLHQDGKLIGVISHVSALKDRIGTQIAILPKAGGRSVVQGPGVEAVAR